MSLKKLLIEKPLTTASIVISLTAFSIIGITQNKITLNQRNYQFIEQWTEHYEVLNKNLEWEKHANRMGKEFGWVSYIPFYNVIKDGLLNSYEFPPIPTIKEKN